MITITRAWTQRGWSPTDHLIDDTRMGEVVGRSYASVEHARRAVEARADSRGYASFEYRAAGGRHYRCDTSARAKIPGRNVPYIRELREQKTKKGA